MKKIIWSLSFVMSLIFISSCNQEDEFVYSCDKKVNEWVEQNIERIQKMSRQDWLNTSKEYSKPIYRAFTQEQKIAFWQEKISEVLMLNWNESEIEHIKKLKDFIDKHKYLFSGKKLGNEDLNTLDLFFYEWKEYAIEKLGWTTKICIAIAGSGYKVANRNGDIEYITSNNTRSSVAPGPSLGDIPECDCNLDNDFCGSVAGPCSKSNCEDTAHGCGWLLAQVCNGECSIAIP